MRPYRCLRRRPFREPSSSGRLYSGWFRNAAVNTVVPPRCERSGTGCSWVHPVPAPVRSASYRQMKRINTPEYPIPELWHDAALAPLSHFPFQKNYMVSLLSYILSNIVSFCNQSCEIIQHMTNFISGYHSVSVHFSYARFCITNYGLKTEQLCVIINPIQEFPFFDSKFVRAERGLVAQKFSKSAVLGLDGPARSDFSHQQRNEQRVILF